MTNNQHEQNDRNKQGQQNQGGNFKNDPDRAREAGKKGGEHSHSGGQGRE